MVPPIFLNFVHPIAKTVEMMVQRVDFERNLKKHPSCEGTITVPINSPITILTKSPCVKVSKIGKQCKGAREAYTLTLVEKVWCKKISILAPNMSP